MHNTSNPPVEFDHQQASSMISSVGFTVISRRRGVVHPSEEKSHHWKIRPPEQVVETKPSPIHELAKAPKC